LAALHNMAHAVKPGGKLLLYVPAIPGSTAKRRSVPSAALEALRPVSSADCLWSPTRALILGMLVSTARSCGKKAIGATDVGGFDLLMPLVKAQDRLDSRFALSISRDRGKV